MTDEEMAEEYAIKSYGNDAFTQAHMPQMIEPIRMYLKQGFLAGLKAGRPQWHDLRENPNDLPKHEKDVQVLYQYCDKVNPYTCLYDIHGEFWLYYNLDNMLLEQFDYPVIAWCEIPTFDKE